VSMVCHAGSGCDRLTLWAQTKQFDHMAGDAIAGGLFKPGNNSLQATVVEALDNAALCTYQMMAVPAAQTVPMAIVQTMDALEHAKVAEEADGAKDTGDPRRLMTFDQPLLDFLNAECTRQRRNCFEHCKARLGDFVPGSSKLFSEGRHCGRQRVSAFVKKTAHRIALLTPEQRFLSHCTICRVLTDSVSQNEGRLICAFYHGIAEWGSILVSGVTAITTIVGVAVVTYLALVLYQSGRTKRDGSVSPRVEQFGSIATGMLGAWFAFFILVGLYTTFFLK